MRERARHDEARMRDVAGDQSDGRGAGIDNLLYSADAEFSCFADLALTSPGEYYKEGEGSLIQAVFDERAVKRSESQLVEDCIAQLNDLFPSSKGLKCTWSKVTKLSQSLYREKTGQDKFRPTQARPPPSSHTRTTHTSLSRTLRRRRRRPSTTFSSPARIRTRTTSTRWRARRGAD